VPLDVQGVRERVLRVGRLGRSSEMGMREGRIFAPDGPPVSLRAVSMILVLGAVFFWGGSVTEGQLVSSTALALDPLSQRFTDLVWGLMFGELRGVS
jgi:hypothetical protein